MNNELDKMKADDANQADGKNANNTEKDMSPHPDNMNHTGAHKEGAYDKQQGPEEVGNVGQDGKTLPKD